MADLVVLFRSPDDPDPYEKALTACGFEARSTAVLAFVFVNQQGLRDALEHPDRYDGLIFTSPRAVDAMGETMPWLPSENVLWHAKPVFAVGLRTAEELRSLGFEPEGEESGSAQMLARLIAGRSFTRPLLFLCGDRRRDVVPEMLQAADVAMEELCVYRTRLRAQIEWPETRKPAWVVFFSPSGYEAVREAGHIDLTGIRIAAIGPTTAEALRDESLDVAAVAEEPSPGALAAAIRAAAGA